MIKQLEQLIEHIPDFPEKGVLFRDISPLLAQKFPETIEAMASLISAEELEKTDAFAGIDARGFIFASALAAKTGKNMLMLRKSGKLPPPSLRKEYELEYGQSGIELRHLKPLSVFIVDDVLATGGTLKAAADLCSEAGHTVHGFVTLIDLKFLNDFSWNNLTVRSLIQYEN